MLIRVIGHQFRTLCVDFFVVSPLERMWAKKNEKRARANLAEGRPMRPILLIGLAILSATSAVANVVDTAVVKVLAYYPNGNVSQGHRLFSGRGRR